MCLRLLQTPQLTHYARLSVALLAVEHPVGLTLLVAHRLPLSGGYYAISAGGLAGLAGIRLLALSPGCLGLGQLTRAHSLTDTGLVIGAGCYLRGDS